MAEWNRDTYQLHDKWYIEQYVYLLFVKFLDAIKCLCVTS